MGDEREIMTAARSRGGIAVSGIVLAGLCWAVLATPAAAQSLTDRFKNLFGGSSEPAPGAAPGGASPATASESDLTCPEVSVRMGASTYAVGMPGKPAAGNDLRYQATIGQTARACSINAGMISVRIGIQGRVIAGPAGAPSSVDVPLRVAVVQEGVSPKTVFTKAYQTNVAMDPQGNVPFSLVAEDVVYPAPPAEVGNAYVFYVGFDPQALKSAPRERPKKR